MEGIWKDALGSRSFSECLCAIDFLASKTIEDFRVPDCFVEINFDGFGIEGDAKAIVDFISKIVDFIDEADETGSDKELWKKEMGGKLVFGERYWI